MEINLSVGFYLFMKYDFFENVVDVFMDKYREDKKEDIRNCGEKRRVFSLSSAAEKNRDHHII
ncbi:hypothetical protein OM343_21740 [Escherichia albertii]|nr:hypothetical protein [Escherichia albertii]